MIRVLHIVGSMNMGGIENFVMNLYRKIDRNKVQFDFLYITNEKCYFDNEIESLGGRIFRITGKSVDIKKHCKELEALLCKHIDDFTAVHIHTATSLSYMDAKIARKVGINKVIIHSHNTSYCKKWLHYIFRPKLIKYGTDFFACSKLAGEWLFSKKHMDNVVIINNAVESDKFIYNIDKRKNIREKLKLEDNFVIGHVGRFNEQKNHRFLIDILNELIKIDKSVKLILVGSGNLENEIINKVQKLGLQDNVIFMGIRDDINDIMQAMDVFVFPSHYEGLPVTLIEAQASGLKCIISDNITNEVDITNLIQYVSLEKKAHEWAKVIIENKYNERINTSDYIDKAGYNINKSIKLIEEIYLS